MTTPAGWREEWLPGETAWFEYHCEESDASEDAGLWHRSHQQVTVTRRGRDEDYWGTWLERQEAGLPRLHVVRFADGFEGEAYEDELLTGPEYYERDDPPALVTAKEES